MSRIEQIEKVLILEKDFPANIPEDIGRKQLEVVNESGETVCIFYDTSFFKMKTQDQVEYIEGFDKLFVFVSGDYIALGDNERAEWCIQNPAFDKNAWSYIEDVCKARIALCRMAHPYGYNYDFFYNNADDDEEFKYLLCWCDLEIKIFSDYGRILIEHVDSIMSCINDEDLTLWEKVIKNLEAWDEDTVGNFFNSRRVSGLLKDKIKDPIKKILQDKNIPYIHRKRLENLIFPREGSEYRYINSFRYTWKTFHKYQSPMDNIHRVNYIHSTDDEELTNYMHEFVNTAGEIIALLYDTSFFGGGVENLSEYLKHHDQIFECREFIDWYRAEDSAHKGNIDCSYEEFDEQHSKMLERLEQLKPDIYTYPIEELSSLGLALIALCRLSYPYLLDDYENVRKFFKDAAYWVKENLLSEQVLLLNDPKVIAKYIEIVGLENLLKFMNEFNYSEMLYENPESFFTKDNIDSFIEYSMTSNNTELLAFLLDYKNKQFPADESVALEISN